MSVFSDEYFTKENVEIQNMLFDYERAIANRRDEYLQYGFDDFADYDWQCPYLTIDEEDVRSIIVIDNYGEEFKVDCDFNLLKYSSDENYKHEILQNLVIALFEGYECA